MTGNRHRKLEQAIGYRFRKKALLERALTHPSYRYENDTDGHDNQRLEFLGDAVLSLVCAEYLFTTRPDATEGDMSKLRSHLTEDRKLAQIGSAIGLGEHLQLGKGEQSSGGAGRASNIADAVEAIIGAAWIDGGKRAAQKIFKKLFLPELGNIETAAPCGNPKGLLQEHAQHNGFGIPTYRTVATHGPEHARTFTLQLEACGKTWQATASSKREAERLAARQALEELRRAAPEEEQG